MPEVTPENVVLAELLFGISGIGKQMQTVEQMANKTALKIKEIFNNAELNMPGINIGQITQQQANINQIMADAQSKRERIVAEGEADITSKMVREALLRERLALQEARKRAMITEQGLVREQQLQMRNRQGSLENAGGDQDTSDSPKISDSISTFADSVSALSTVYSILSPLFETTKVAQTAMTTTTLASASATMFQTTATEATAGALVVESGAMVTTTVVTEAATVATNAFNAALKRNPLGLVATLLATVAGVALTSYISKLGQADKAQQSLNNHQNEFSNAQTLAMQSNNAIKTLENLKEKHAQLSKEISSGQLSTQKLTEARGKLSKVEETILMFADPSMRARIKSNGLTQEEIQLVINSAIESKKAAIAKLQNEKDLADQTVEQTRKRVKALETENNLFLTLAQGQPATTPVFAQPFILPVKGSTKNPALKAAQDEYDQAQADAYEKTQILITALGDLDALMETSGSVFSGGYSEKVDTLKTALEQLGNASRIYEFQNAALESSFERLNERLSTVNAEYDYLNRKVTTGTVTSADFARMQELVAIKTKTLSDQEAGMLNINLNYQQQIDALTPKLARATSEYERFKAAGDYEHMEDASSAASSLRSEIDRLSGAISSNTARIYENKATMEELSKATYSAYYQQAMNWMNHMEAIGRMNNQQQLDYLNTIDKSKLGRSDAWQREEDQYRRRQQAIRDEVNALKEAYDARMAQIQDEIDANERLIEQKQQELADYKEGIDSQIAAIQKLKDALDDKKTGNERAKAQREHNEKLAELQKKLQYEQMRTGSDHVKNVEETNKQIAEENQKWADTQANWAIDAQKEAYDQQIQALRDQSKAREDSVNKEINQLKQANNDKKEALEKYYKQIEGLLSDNVQNMLATIGGYDSQFYEKGLNAIKAFAQGMNDAMPSIPSDLMDFLTGGINSKYNSLPADSGRPDKPEGEVIATISPGEYQNQGGTTYMKSRDLAGRLQQTVSWDQASGEVIIGGHAFKPARNDNGTTWVGIRQVAEALGYKVKWDQVYGTITILDKAHTGAYVAQGGAAELLKGERVLSPQLTASFDRLAYILLRSPDISGRIAGSSNPDLSQIADRVIAAIERRKLVVDKAVHIENFVAGDTTDLDLLSRETARRVAAIM